MPFCGGGPACMLGLLLLVFEVLALCGLLGAMVLSVLDEVAAELAELSDFFDLLFLVVVPPWVKSVLWLWLCARAGLTARNSPKLQSNRVPINVFRIVMITLLLCVVLRDCALLLKPHLSSG